MIQTTHHALFTPCILAAYHHVFLDILLGVESQSVHDLMLSNIWIALLLWYMNCLVILKLIVWGLPYFRCTKFSLLHASCRRHPLRESLICAPSYNLAILTMQFQSQCTDSVAEPQGTQAESQKEVDYSILYYVIPVIIAVGIGIVVFSLRKAKPAA